MLGRRRRHHPAVAEATELPATLAADGAAADVFGNVQRREESRRAAGVLHLP